MPLETFGSAEAILRILTTYQGANGRRPDPGELWTKISEYVVNGGEYRFYPLWECASSQPAGSFLLDLLSLIKAGHLRIIEDGLVEVTPFGRSYARILQVPDTLRVLEQEIDERVESALRHDAQ